MVEPSHAATRVRIVPFRTSPFPYDGLNPKTGEPFIDASDGDRRGHTGRDGTVYFEKETYSDRSVLLALSYRFRPPRAALVIFLHGNGAVLQRDVIDRQRVVAQFFGSRLNGALVAPQFALDAHDSSPGHFWETGFFARFLEEAAERLAAMSGYRRQIINEMPVVLVAYSGGYYPASSILVRGGAAARIVGVVLLDALYGEQRIFADWVMHNRKRGFFFSAFSKSTEDQNIDFEALLQERGLATVEEIPKRIGPGSIVFMPGDPDVVHQDFVTDGWERDSLRAVLSRIAI